MAIVNGITVTHAVVESTNVYWKSVIRFLNMYYFNFQVLSVAQMEQQ